MPVKTLLCLGHTGQGEHYNVKTATLFGCKEQGCVLMGIQSTKTDLDHTIQSLPLPLAPALSALGGFPLNFLSTWSASQLVPLFLSLLTLSDSSQQLLGSDGWTPQCKTLTYNLVTDNPSALLCWSLKTCRHTAVVTNKHTHGYIATGCA